MDRCLQSMQRSCSKSRPTVGDRLGKAVRTRASWVFVSEDVPPYHNQDVMSKIHAAKPRTVVPVHIGSVALASRSGEDRRLSNLLHELALPSERRDVERGASDSETGRYPAPFTQVCQVIHVFFFSVCPAS